MHRLRFAATLALMALSALSCSAQYTVKRLVFRGADLYAQQQLEAVAALKPGEHIGTREMGEAAQRLMDTGVFADVETTLNGPMAGIDVVFKLKPLPAGSFLPVSFENFVWLTDEERDSGLRQRVPLYSGAMPAGSNLQTAVQAALTQMLAEKNVTATVETTEEPSTVSRARPLIAFRVTSPKVVLSTVRLSGVTSALAEPERAVIGKLSGKPYNDGIDTPLSRMLVQPYLDAGFIDARLINRSQTPAPAEGES